LAGYGSDATRQYCSATQKAQQTWLLLCGPETEGSVHAQRPWHRHFFLKFWSHLHPVDSPVVMRQAAWFGCRHIFGHADSNGRRLFASGRWRWPKQVKLAKFEACPVLVFIFSVCLLCNCFSTVKIISFRVLLTRV
jgi:hypothetical protein